MLADMSLIRGTALLGYPELVAEIGGDPTALLSATGIPLSSVGDYEAFLGYLAAVTAVESAARVTSTPDFGRRLALRQGVEILGPVGAAARTAPTVAAAFDSIVQYLAFYSPAITATVDTADDDRYSRMEFHIAVGPLPDHRQSMELSLGVALRVFRLLIGPDFQPVTVHIPHHPMTPAADYRRYFGCRPRFAEPIAGFTFRSTDLARRVSADSDIHNAVRAYLDTVAPPGMPNTTETVRLLIRHLLPTGGLELAVVARQLSMHPRTLQRRLANAATSFEDLVDDVRRERARNLLRDTDMPMGQLAATLGYSEQSVLTRACQRWFGRTPSQQRRENPGLIGRDRRKS